MQEIPKKIFLDGQPYFYYFDFRPMARYAITALLLLIFTGQLLGFYRFQLKKPCESAVLLESSQTFLEKNLEQEPVAAFPLLRNVFIYNSPDCVTLQLFDESRKVFNHLHKLYCRPPPII